MQKKWETEQSLQQSSNHAVPRDQAILFQADFKVKISRSLCSNMTSTSNIVKHSKSNSVFKVEVCLRAKVGVRICPSPNSLDSVKCENCKSEFKATDLKNRKFGEKKERLSNHCYQAATAQSLKSNRTYSKQISKWKCNHRGWEHSSRPNEQIYKNAGWISADRNARLLSCLQYPVQY